jgi:hypothetical protein
MKETYNKKRKRVPQREEGKNAWPLPANPKLTGIPDLLTGKPRFIVFVRGPVEYDGYGIR